MFARKIGQVVFLSIFAVAIICIINHYNAKIDVTEKALQTEKTLVETSARELAGVQEAEAEGIQRGEPGIIVKMFAWSFVVMVALLWILVSVLLAARTITGFGKTKKEVRQREHR